MFPLATGTCRNVCRPNRKVARVVTPRAAVRFAKAAVDHGANPCVVAGLVAKELGCVPCQELIPSVIEALDVQQEAINRLQKALADLQSALGGGSAKGGKGWLKKLLGALSNLQQITLIFSSVVALMEAVEDTKPLMGGVAQVLSLVEACLEKASK